MKNRFTETPMFHIAASAGLVIFAILVGGAVASKIANSRTVSSASYNSSSSSESITKSSARAIDEGEQLYELAVAYESTGDYAKALDTLSEISPNSTKYAAATEKTVTVKNTYTNVATQSAKTAYNAGNYELAIQIMEDLHQRIPESADITVAYEHLVEDCKNSLLDSSKSAFQTSGWKAALDVLNNAPAQLKDDSDIAKQIDSYRKSGATRLDTLKPFRGDSLTTSGTIADCFGNEHSNCLRFWTGSLSYNDRTFRIDKQYSTLTGTAFSDSTNNRWFGSFIISGDDQVLQRIEVNGGSDPITFEVDVSDVKDLTVESINGGYGTEFYVSDLLLNP